MNGRRARVGARPATVTVNAGRPLEEGSGKEGKETFVRTTDKRNVKRSLAIVLCMVVPMTICAAESSYWVVYNGGSVGEIRVGSSVIMAVGSDQIRLINKGDQAYTTIPASAVTEVSYGQDVHRRVRENPAAPDCSAGKYPANVVAPSAVPRESV
jgi:hypothetical protein